MNNITDDKNFYYGIPTISQWGLYSMVDDRFLFVTDQLFPLKYLSFIISSKINLTIIKISESKNFNLKLIDNSCCTRWGVEFNNIEIGNLKLRISNLNLEKNDVLVDRGYKNFEIFQKILFLTFKVINFFDKCDYYPVYNNLIDFPFQDDCVKQCLKIKKDCYNLLYYCNNAEDVEDDINKNLNDVENLLGIKVI